MIYLKFNKNALWNIAKIYQTINCVRERKGRECGEILNR